VKKEERTRRFEWVSKRRPDASDKVLDSREASSKGRAGSTVFQKLLSKRGGLEAQESPKKNGRAGGAARYGLSKF